MDGGRGLVIGAGGGIGSALLRVLGPSAIGLGRSTQPPLDLLDEASMREAAKTLSFQGPFSRIIVATGALTIGARGPEKRLQDLDPGVMAAAFAINTIGPALLLKHFTELLPRQGRCVFAILSARVGSIGDNRLGGWYSYRASKAALNQVVRTASVEVARRRPEAVLLALHPGTVRTNLSAAFIAPEAGVSPEEAASRLLHAIDHASETGRFLDYAATQIPW